MPRLCRSYGQSGQFEAMWTAAAGLTGGRSIGGTLCYLPQETVSRAEFLVMAMELLDVPVDDTLRVSRLCGMPTTRPRGSSPISPQPCAAASSTAWSPSAASSSARMSRSRPGRPPSCCRTCWSSPSPQPSPRRRAVLGGLVHAGPAGSGDPAGRRGHERQSHRSGAHALPCQPPEEIIRRATERTKPSHHGVYRSQDGSSIA